jgi:hypothetical protein
VIAALYVDPRGPYASMPDVDAWPASRDARNYAGPWPVVAHPPCGAYGALRHLHARPDADCGPRAVEQVRAFCGVLEHPRGSKLWAHCGLPLPGEMPDAHGGYSVEVSQCDWGHVARKRTWLYLVGVPGCALEAAPFPNRAPTHWASGGRRHNRKGSGGFAPAGVKICSAQQRRRTPLPFAQYLVRLATACAVPVRASRGAR